MTFKTILFPTDFSKEGNSALLVAMQLANFHEGEIIVEHVVSNYFGPHSHWASLFDVHELQKQFDFHVDSEMARLLSDEDKGGIRFRRVIRQGKPPEEICKLAHEEMVDLIVMGSTSGLTTMKVMRGATRPVLSVPVRNNRQDSKIKQILVATDFTRQSKKVTNYAFDLKKLFQCPLYLVYSVRTPGALARTLRQDHFAKSMDKSREWAESQMRNVIPSDFASDDSVKTIVEVGPTSDSIIGAAKQIDASLIVIGAKGYGPIQQHFYGTTVDRVLTKAACPVLTLRV